MKQKSKHQYDYAYVPLSPAERELVEKMILAGEAKNVGQAVHKLAFEAHLISSDSPLHLIRAYQEDVRALHKEILDKLKYTPLEFARYESDLIAMADHIDTIDDKITVALQLLIGGVEDGDIVSYSNPY